jgi:hypothetical protein
MIALPPELVVSLLPLLLQPADPTTVANTERPRTIRIAELMFEP